MTPPTLDSIFLLVSLLPLPFWFLMIVLPHWKGTQRVMARRGVLMPLLAAYAVLVVPQLPTILPLFVRSTPLSLTQLAALFGRPEAALAGWVHFLAFDLFVGRWIYRDARERGVGAWVSGPVLLATLLLGPLGLLLYLLARTQFATNIANRT